MPEGMRGTVVCGGLAPPPLEALLEAMTDLLLCKLDPHTDATAHGTEFTDPPKPTWDPFVPSPPILEARGVRAGAKEPPPPLHMQQPPPSLFHKDRPQFTSGETKSQGLHYGLLCFTPFSRGRKATQAS